MFSFILSVRSVLRKLTEPGVHRSDQIWTEILNRVMSWSRISVYIWYKVVAVRKRYVLNICCEISSFDLLTLYWPAELKIWSLVNNSLEYFTEQLCTLRYCMTRLWIFKSYVLVCHQVGTRLWNCLQSIPANWICVTSKTWKTFYFNWQSATVYCPIVYDNFHKWI